MMFSPQTTQVLVIATAMRTSRKVKVREGAILLLRAFTRLMREWEYSDGQWTGAVVQYYDLFDEALETFKSVGDPLSFQL